MRSSAIFIICFYGLSSALRWEGYQTLPDGQYQSVIFPNGTTTVQSITDPSFSATFHLSPDTEGDDGLEKRLTQCWGTALNTDDTDRAVQSLRDLANEAGGFTWVSYDSPGELFIVSGSVKAYYCLNAGGLTGNIDLVDVNYALTQMDAECPRYTASFFEWPGSYEIIGKCSWDTATCLGGLMG